MSYVTAWIGFCLLAVGVGFARRQAMVNELPDYLRDLTVRWKVLSFLPAFVFVTFVGRLTNDPTWDVITGGGMAVLTFATAPWAVGTIGNVCRGRRHIVDILAAVALWLFSSRRF